MENIDKFESEKGKFIIQSYLKEVSLTQSNLDSFNDFFERRIQEIIDRINEQLKQDKANIELGRIWLGKAEFIEVDGTKKEILPIEARIRKLTYSAPLYLEIGYVGKDKHVIEIARVPVMVKSKFCNLYGLSEEELIEKGEDPKDPGGYFIINGNERAIMMMEDLASNNIFVEPTEKGLSLRLFSQRDSYRIPLQIYLDKDGIIKVNFSRFKDIPAIILIKALGMTKDAEIANSIGLDYDEIVVNLYEFAEISSVEAAWQWLAEKFELSGSQKEIKDIIKTRLDNGLLPHLGVKVSDRLNKASLLCKLIKQFLIYKHEKIETDKDHIANKRVRLSGDLLYDLFKTHLTLFIRDIEHSIEKYARRGKLPELRTIAKSILLSNRIESSLATGSWVGEKRGVTQNIDKTNLLAKISQLLRVVSLLSSEQENFLARTLHPTQYGRFCPIETPEGTNIGLRKNLALLARVTTEIVLDENKFVKLLKSIGLSENGEYDVLWNGKFIGRANLEFIKAFKQKRRQNEIHKFISISYDKYAKIIHIFSDAGRVVRPLIVVENGNPALTIEHIEKLKKGELGFNDLVKQGIIEWVDASEEDNCLVALNTRQLNNGDAYDYLEIDALAMLGLVTALVPYANHNQTSRLNRGSKTQKQALGLYAANYPLLMDTDVNLLHYPQKPLVKSLAYDYAGFWPAGQNVIVAIAPFYGYNMEDAIILNKGSIDRAFARSHYFRPYTTVEMRYTGALKDKICIPEKDVKGYKAEKLYMHLEDDGIAYVEAEMKEEEVVIGKVSPPKFMIEMEELTIEKIKKENSIAIREEEKGIVDAVFLSIDADGNKIVQVRTRDHRLPELGDKFSSYYGQKGVVGYIFNEVDMPFTARGIKPDLIFNPHGIPSRMTVGYLLELLAGKVASNKAEIIDGTAFRGMKPEELEAMLLELGFRPDGKELMFDPISGKAFEAKIYVGSMYYLKLKYMVGNKLHARATGKVALLTRQPVEGRAKGGGLRLGEMEKDCLVAHGASLLLKERFGSDDVIVYVCSNCGAIGYKDYIKNKLVCPLCNSNKLEPVEIAYASKLLFEELQSMHFGIDLKLKNKFEQ